METLQFDVVVIGAGPAGMAAALAAARAGCRTLLVERLGAAGGTFSHGLALTPVGFEPFKYWTTRTDPDGWLVQGIARELHDRMAAAGGVQKPVWDPELYKGVVDTMLAAAGVHTLYHATCTDVLREGDRVTGVVLATRAGAWRVRAAVTIDGSGDGEVLAGAGCAFDKGRPSDGRCQPMMLACIFGGVRLPWTPAMSYAEKMEVGRQVAAPLLQAAWRAGEIPPVFTGYLFPRVAGGRVLDDQVWCRMVQSWSDPTDPWQVTQAEIQCRDSLRKVHAWMRQHVPGFEASVLLQTSVQVWARETRRLQGVDTLTEDDVAANQRYDDGIARGACFFEIHSATPGDPNPAAGYEWHAPASRHGDDVDYDIRYGCLVPASVNGLLVAGRCLSATHLALSSARMQVTVMAMGEAAGLAAAQCVNGRLQPREVDVQALRAALRHQGARV